MKALILFILILTVVSVVGLRIWQALPWRATSPAWDRKQQYNLVNLAWLTGLTIFVIMAPLPWWMGLVILLPILVLCAWSLSAAYDWDDTTSIGDFADRWTWGETGPATKLRLKIRRFAFIGVLGLLAITWISLAITSAVTNGTRTEGQPPAASPSVTTPTTAPTTPPAQPTSSPTVSPSATGSSSQKCMDEIPVDKAVNDLFLSKTAHDATEIQACLDGSWTGVPVKGDQQIKVLKWVQDKAAGYAYTLIDLKGKQVWTRTPLDK